MGMGRGEGRDWPGTHNDNAPSRPLSSTAGAFWLYDMENDIGQTTDLSAQNPDIVSQMLQVMKEQKDPNYAAGL